MISLQFKYAKYHLYLVAFLKVAESVRLQAELHEKEKLILRQQRKRCQKVYKDLDSLRIKMTEAQGNLIYFCAIFQINSYYLENQ